MQDGIFLPFLHQMLVNFDQQILPSDHFPFL